MNFLSPHFSLEELCHSATADRQGVDNEAPPEAVENLRRLCLAVLEPLRDSLGFPLVVNSGYRCPKLNDLVGGVSDSQHMKGEAADIECPRLSNRQLAEIIRGLGLPYDQLILEHVFGAEPHNGWVHVSHRGYGNRKQFIAIPRPRNLRE